MEDRNDYDRDENQPERFIFGTNEDNNIEEGDQDADLKNAPSKLGGIQNFKRNIEQMQKHSHSSSSENLLERLITMKEREQRQG